MASLVLDIDCIIFDAVSVAEERFIIAHHIPTGRKMEFENKTALWGDWRKKQGGWCSEENKKLGSTYWKAEDFEVVEGQRPRPFKIKGVCEFSGEPDPVKDYFITPWEGAKKILDDKIKTICKTLGTDEYIGYTGTGDVFRHDVCTLLRYKDRDDIMKPLLLKRMKEYVCERHSTTLVTHEEADDWVAMKVLEGYNNWVKNGKKDEDIVIGVAEDKDSKQTSGWWFNPNKDTKPRLIEGLGSLWLNDKGDPDGCGRMWLYFQVGAQDKADNYSAQCFSDVPWGDKKAYTELIDCKTDKEAFESLVGIFKKLYPKKKTVQGCKGPVEIDWLYVMQECFTMALMLRKLGDGINVKETLEKLKIEY